MKKKNYSFTLLLLFCFFYLSLFLFPSETYGDYSDIYGTHCSNGEYNYIISNDNTITIEKYIGDSANANIPDSINGINVTQIGSESFQNNKITILVNVK